MLSSSVSAKKLPIGRDAQLLAAFDDFQAINVEAAERWDELTNLAEQRRAVERSVGEAAAGLSAAHPQWLLRLRARLDASSSETVSELQRVLIERAARVGALLHAGCDTHSATTAADLCLLADDVDAFIDAYKRRMDALADETMNFVASKKSQPVMPSLKLAGGHAAARALRRLREDLKRNC